MTNQPSRTESLRAQQNRLLDEQWERFDLPAMMPFRRLTQLSMDEIRALLTLLIEAGMLIKVDPGYAVTALGEKYISAVLGEQEPEKQ